MDESLQLGFLVASSKSLSLSFNQLLMRTITHSPSGRPSVDQLPVTVNGAPVLRTFSKSDVMPEDIFFLEQPSLPAS